MKTKKSNSKKAASKSGVTIKKTATKKTIATPKKITAPDKKVALAIISVNNPVKEKGKEVFRYNDKELNEFKKLINERLDAAKEELLFMQGQMSSDPRLSLEDGSGAMDREQLSTLTSREVQYISNLEKALIRIINKTYGVCRETGKLIDKARLRAVPHATLSIEAKNNAQGKK